MKIDETTVMLIEVYDVKDPKPFTSYNYFTIHYGRNKQNISDIYHSLIEYFNNDLNENIAILITVDGIFIFTEDKVIFDDILLKLSISATHSGSGQYDMCREFQHILSNLQDEIDFHQKMGSKHNGIAVDKINSLINRGK